MFPLEIWWYVASFLNERDLLALTRTARAPRCAAIGALRDRAKTCALRALSESSVLLFESLGVDYFIFLCSPFDFGKYSSPETHLRHAVGYAGAKVLEFLKAAPRVRSVTTRFTSAHATALLTVPSITFLSVTNWIFLHSFPSTLVTLHLVFELIHGDTHHSAPPHAVALPPGLRELRVFHLCGTLRVATRLDMLRELVTDSHIEFDHPATHLRTLIVQPPVLFFPQRPRRTPWRYDLDQFPGLTYIRCAAHVVRGAWPATLTRFRARGLAAASLPALAALRRISLDGCDLVDLAPLAAATLVSKLSLADCENITSLRGIGNLLSLETLKLRALPNLDLHSLSECRARYLSITGITVHNFTPFIRMEMIQEISFHGVKIQSLEGAELIVNTPLRKIFIYNVQVDVIQLYQTLVPLGIVVN